MTTDTSATLDPSVPRMGAEAGYELDESVTPLRVSGFVTLLLGLLSALSLLGTPVLIIPVAALLLGLFAVRRWDGPRPIGVRPAQIGLVLAAGFGACGLFLPWMKTYTLGKQAEHFSRQYMEVVARGHDEFAMELRKDYVNRFPATMPLAEHYRLNNTANEQLIEFRESSLNGLLRRRGPNAEWVLDRPTRVYYSYEREHAEVVWMDPTGETQAKVQVFLEYRVDSNGEGQWHIENAQEYRERIVAESIL